MTLTGTDVAVAVAIAAVVILIAVVYWPGYARVRSSDLEGDWADERGELYRISPSPNSTSEILILSLGIRVTGEIHWLRGITVGKESGRVTFGGDIVWASGSVWLRQGVPSRKK